MLNVLFILILLSIGTLGFIAATTLALHTFTGMGARINSWRTNRNSRNAAVRTLRDPVYGTVIDAVTGTVIKPGAGMEFSEAAKAANKNAVRGDMAVIATDRSGRIRSISPEGEILLRLENGKVRNKNIIEFFTKSELDVMTSLLKASGKENVDGFEGLVNECLSGSLEEQEWTWINGNEESFCVSLTITTLRDEAGGLEGFLFDARRKSLAPSATAAPTSTTATPMPATHGLPVGEESDLKNNGKEEKKPEESPVEGKALQPA